MSILRLHKVISTLPSQLDPNALYAVRTGAGFDLYITDSTGNIAHKINPNLDNDLLLSVQSNFPPKPPGYDNCVVPYAVTATAATTLALTASRTYWIPIVVSVPVTISQVAINVTTVSAGNHIVGIYSSNARGEPNTKLIEWTFTADTTGVKASTSGLPLTLQRGIYWIAWAAGSAATVRAIALAAARSLGLPALGTANLTCWYTSGGTLPQTAPTSGYIAITGSALPAVGFYYNFNI